MSQLFSTTSLLLSWRWGLGPGWPGTTAPASHSATTSPLFVWEARGAIAATTITKTRKQYFRLKGVSFYLFLRETFRWNHTYSPVIQGQSYGWVNYKVYLETTYTKSLLRIDVLFKNQGCRSVRGVSARCCRVIIRPPRSNGKDDFSLWDSVRHGCSQCCKPQSSRLFKHTLATTILGFWSLVKFKVVDLYGLFAGEYFNMRVTGNRKQNLPKNILQIEFTKRFPCTQSQHRIIKTFNFLSEYEHFV